MPYYFRLPQFNQLTIEQQAALNDFNPIALSGRPGTGKSVVCLWRHIRNGNQLNKSSLLLTYTKTLEYYFRGSVSNEIYSNAGRVARTISCNNLNYDEIIIDEAQDVGSDDYIKFGPYSNVVSFSADDAQQLYTEGCDLNTLDQLFPSRNRYTLYHNFRNSREILNFVRFALPNKFIPKSILNNLTSTGAKPILKVCGERKQQLRYILDVIYEYTSDTHNIAILLPIQRMANAYYEDLQNILVSRGISCSKYVSDDDGIEQIADVHITTFKSAKGTEFDTVIIPDFEQMQSKIRDLRLISDKDYYVGFTRAKLNLFLTCDTLPNIDFKDSVEIEY